MIATMPIPVTKAANSLGITTGRVRQLCIQHKLGTLLNPRCRILTKEHVKTLRKILSEPKRGRRRKNFQK